MSILDNEGHDPDGFGNRHTEDSEMQEPRRMSEAELTEGLDARYGTGGKPADDEPSFAEFDDAESLADIFVRSAMGERPDVSRYPIDPDRAAKKEAWYASQGFGTLRVRAIEVTETVGEVSRKTRYEFEGGGPCEVWGMNGPVGSEIFVSPLEEPPEDI